MTKKELIKALEPFPDGMEVLIDQRITEEGCGLVNSVRKEIVFFTDVPKYKEDEEVECIIISEK